MRANSSFEGRRFVGFSLESGIVTPDETPFLHQRIAETMPRQKDARIYAIENWIPAQDPCYKIQ